MMVRQFFLVLVLCCPIWADWQPLGPFGGAASVVEVDPHHKGTVIAATNNGLLFRSRDSGDSWAAVPFPAQLRGTLHSFVIDSKTPNLYYVGFASESAEYSGLYRSVDEGATWERVPGLKEKHVWSLATWAVDSRVLAAGTGEGVFLSRDSGASWTQISPTTNRELRPVVSIAFDPLDSKIVYAGTPHLPWKTTDGGITWRSIHAGMLDDSDVFAIHVDRHKPQRVFACACSGIYRSLHGGRIWTKLTGARGASYRTYFVTIDPHNSDVVYAGTTHGLVQSIDGGTTWQQLSSYTTRWVAFDPDRAGRIYVATDDPGILRSDDGGKTLQPINNGFCNRHLPSVERAGNALLTNTIYQPADGGVFELSAAANSWQRLAPESKLLGEQVLSIAITPGSPRLYAAGYHEMLTSEDGGRTWSRLPGPGGARVSSLLTASGDGNHVLAASELGLYHSDNGGKSWKKIDLPGNPPIRSLVRLGTSLVAAVASSGGYLSTDGIRWNAMGPLPEGTHFYGIAGTETDGFVAATSNGVFRSGDLGKSWEPVRGALDGNTVNAICAHPDRAGVFFAGGYGFVYSSEDEGRTWNRVRSENLSIQSIKQLLVLPGSPDRLIALTQSQGIFAFPLAASASGVTVTKQ